MGTNRMFGGLGGAAGPLFAGVLAETAGTRSPVVVLACAGAAVAAVILLVGEARAGAVAAEAASED